jgi:Recombinase.
MNALYLKDLGDKTRRGMIAAVLNGVIPGGRSYGYDIVYQLNERGEPIPGQRKINEAEADVVRNIFARYANGESLKQICRHLNEAGVLSPRGAKWQMSVLIGTAARQTGILRNTLYKGLITFDRMAYRKHPDTGKRLSVMRPESEWIRVPAPELAIVGEELFDRVQVLIEERSSGHRQKLLAAQVMTSQEKRKQKREYLRSWRARQYQTVPRIREQPLYLTTGKLWCARHDTAIVFRRSRLHGCREPKCANQNLPLDYMLPKVIAELQRFDAAAIVRHFADLASRRANLLNAIQQLESRRTTVQQEIRALLRSIARSQRGPETMAHIQDLEKDSGRLRLDIEQLSAELRDITSPSDDAIAAIVDSFQDALARSAGDPEAIRAIHSCIERIHVVPDWNDAEQSMQHRVRIQYDFAAIVRTFGAAPGGAGDDTTAAWKRSSGDAKLCPSRPTYGVIMINYSAEDLERFAPNDELLDKLFDAEKRGDEAAAEEIRRQILYPAETLLAIKETRGADWLRRRGWRLDEAERKYGKDWLDRDIAE